MRCMKTVLVTVKAAIQKKIISLFAAVLDVLIIRLFCQNSADSAIRNRGYFVKIHQTICLVFRITALYTICTSFVLL